MTVPASLSKWAHPPRSNTPRSSSSGPPGPCITPSTETCVVVVSFMVAVPLSLFRVPLEQGWGCDSGLHVPTRHAEHFRLVMEHHLRVRAREDPERRPSETCATA